MFLYPYLRCQSCLGYSGQQMVAAAAEKPGDARCNGRRGSYRHGGTCPAEND